MASPSYPRILLKISGEAFSGKEGFGVSHLATSHVAEQIASIHESGVQIGVVMGAGNLFRGIQLGPELSIERTPADQMGMLSTLINGIALKRALLQSGCSVALLSALPCPTVAETYQWDQAMNYLNEGKIVLFVGGTGHPYFTTDTAAALRACEIHANILLKATTHVDKIYDQDPRKHPDAKPYDQISFQEILEKRLGILDLTAVTLCQEANIPIRVFNFYQGPLLDALSSKPPGTLVK